MKVSGGAADEKITFTAGEGTITVKGGQTKTIEGLPQGVKYTVVEAIDNQFTADKQKVTGTIAETAGTAAFTNTRKTGGLVVHKTVKSSTTADRTKEFTFTVTLTGMTIADGVYGDMTFKDNVATVKVAGGSSKTATGLPTGIEYTVTETSEDGFVATYTGDTGTICLEPSHAAFTNVKDEGGLVVSKKVVSAITNDHTTKEFTIKVTLYKADGENVETSINETYGDAEFKEGVATLTLKDGDVKVIDGLPNGIKYTVTEELTGDDGKTFTVTYSGETGNIEKDKTKLAQVTNTRKTTDLTLTKKVFSGIAADKDEAFLFTLTLSEPITGVYSGVYIENGKVQLWLKHDQSITLKGIPYGTKYEVKEAEDDRFETTIPANASGKLENTAVAVEFKNTRKTFDLTLEKKLISEVEADQNATYVFLVQLGEMINGEFEEELISGTFGGATFTNGRAKVEIKGSGTKVIRGLPAGVTYQIAEAYIANMEADKSVITGTLDGNKKETITNTRETGKLTVKKTVVSNNKADEDKGFDFTITLTGVKGPKTYTATGALTEVTFNADGKAAITLKHDQYVTISGLPAGVAYTVTEADVSGEKFVTTSTGDKGTIGANGTSTAAFTNTKSEGGLVVSKKVFSALTDDHSKPFAITVTLADKSITGTFGDAEFKDGIANLTLKDGEVAVITGLPNELGYEVTETLTDDDLNAFKVEYTGETATEASVSGTIKTDETQKALVTNTRITKELMITKKVDSTLASDKKEAFLFKVTMDPKVSGEYGGVYFKDGIAQIWVKDGEPVTLAGIPYNTKYTVEEIDVPSRFNVVGDKSQSGVLKEKDGAVTFTNKAEYVTLPVEKIWDDEGNENMRPESIIAVLKADGETVTTRTLNAGNGWKATASNLPKYKDGKIIKYTWEEASVPEGYTESYAGENNRTITNRLLIGDLLIRKTITGGDGVDFSNLTFRIVGPYGFDETVKYSEFTGGVYVLHDLPIGDYVVYETNAASISLQVALKSDSVTAVKATVEDGSETTAELKNNYERRTTGVMVMKIWEDNDNEYGTRPAEIVMSLSNGMTATLNAANNWMAEINNLPMFDADGREIFYSWTEPPVPGYVMTSRITIGNATVFTNSHGGLTSVSVTKIWDDANNEMGLRPARLRVTLQPTGQTYYLSPANNWTVTVENLPKFNGDTEIEYTWTEQTVLGYTSQKKVVDGVTVFTNHFGVTPPPGIPGRPRTPVYVVKDYETPLGVEVMINHVGDCFD